MNNIQFSSRETDRKVLIVLFSLAFSAFVGYLLPTPLDYPGIQFFDAFITVALGVLVWGVFRLLEPARRYSRTWVIAKNAGIPIVWALLVLVLAVWFYHLNTNERVLQTQIILMR
jgi:hypothetical protein